MKYSELINCLEKKAGIKPKQIDLCRILNLKPTAISARAQRNSAFSDEEIEKIEKKYSIKIESREKFIKINFYINNDLLFNNNGKVELSTNYVEYKIPSNLFCSDIDKKTYSMFHMLDNSMNPLIDFGDFVIFENNSNFNIENNKLYVFSYNNRVYLKRLSFNIKELVIESQNPDFTVQYLAENDLDGLSILGKVVCHGKIYNGGLIKDCINY